LLENGRALFSAAAAFLGYDVFIQETGEIVPEMRAPTQRSLEGFGGHYYTIKLLKDSLINLILVAHKSM